MMNKEDWKVFRIDDVFDMFTGASINQNKFREGDIPRITATDMNNGIGLFTERLSEKNYRSFHNFISISFLGSVFYHDYEASLDMKIHGLKVKDKELNPKLALFLIVCLKNSLPKASYGNQLSSKDLSTKSILLPVDDSGTPDWAFMEEYIQIKSNQINDTYQLSKQHEITDFRELDEVEWKDFFVADIFKVPKRGKRIISSNYEIGSKPVVSSAGSNNGIIAFVGNEKGVREYQNGLSVANGGVSAGFAFYHPYRFIATDHVTHFIGENLNRFHYLFLSLIIKNQMKEKYHFSREMSDSRIKREKLLLPITQDGFPDFQFMEQYMKRMENRVMQKMEK